MGTEKFAENEAKINRCVQDYLLTDELSRWFNMLSIDMPKMDAVMIHIWGPYCRRSVRSSLYYGITFSKWIKNVHDFLSNFMYVRFFSLSSYVGFLSVYGLLGLQRSCHPHQVTKWTIWPRIFHAPSATRRFPPEIRCSSMRRLSTVANKYKNYFWHE